MPRRKYAICLTPGELERLKCVVSKGTCPARTIKRAQVLLNLDNSAGMKRDIGDLCRFLAISRNTVNRILKTYKEIGVGCIYRKKRSTPPVERKITGEVDAHLMALACHNPPEGYCRWTLRLLSERMVEMGYIDSISHTAVGTVLKRNGLKPHLVEEWCTPRSRVRHSPPAWRTSWRCTAVHMTKPAPWYAWTKNRCSCWQRPAGDTAKATAPLFRTASTCTTGLAAYSCSRSHLPATVMPQPWSTGPRWTGRGR